MDTDRPEAEQRRQAAESRPRSRLFLVRLWKVEGCGGVEYRGSVRDVVSGAWLHFRDWSDAQSFVTQQVDQHERESTTNQNGGP
jgi:hypothetical protein